MLAELRLAQIYDQFAEVIERIIPLVVEDETLQIILYFIDGTNLRIVEKWRGETLERYSYYWLMSDNQLKIGWDNSPHHRKLENFPHHKHVTHQTDLQSSDETTLDAVMKIVIEEMK